MALRSVEDSYGTIRSLIAHSWLRLNLQTIAFTTYSLGPSSFMFFITRDCKALSEGAHLLLEDDFGELYE